MINIAICDDDKQDRKSLQMLVQKYLRKVNIKFRLRLFEEGEQFLISGYIPDILFLDILMTNKDGIQVGTEVKRINKGMLIIYTTNIPHKMAVAFNQVHSFGYLMKPVTKNDVFNMMYDAIRQMDSKLDVGEEIITFVSEESEIIRLHAIDIYYFENIERKVKIVTKDHSFICREKITDIADKMEKYGFAMSHQSFVVNLYYVDRMSGQMLFMKNGAQVYLAQKRAAALKKQLMMTARKSVNDGGSKD